MTSAQGKFRVGVLGGGVMAHRHVASLLTMPGADLVGVAAPEMDPELLRLCAGAGVEVRGDMPALLRLRDLDAVVVATPTDSHVGLVQDAADAGLHVFCEKPLARTAKEARLAAQHCEAAGVRLAVGHVVRYFPAYAKLHAMIHAGQVGPPGMVKCRRMSGPPGATRQWYADGDRSGGLLTDMGVHDFDWLLWCLGPVDRVSALVADSGVGQVAMVILAHASGAISSVELSWMDPTGFWTSVEVSGPKGLLRHDSRSSADFWIDHFPGSTASPPTVQVPVTQAHDDPYRDELDEALRWFSGGRPPRSAPADAVAAVALADAAHLSSQLREPVAPEVEGKG